MQHSVAAEEWIHVLVGGNGKGASTRLAFMTSIQAGGQNVAIFAHFTEITCTVVPAVLKGIILQAMVI